MTVMEREVTSASELEHLTEVAEAAYDRVRREIIDPMPPPARIDTSELDEFQLWAIQQLERAEQELADYRRRTYARDDAAQLVAVT
jgi:hypothetical protein